MYSGYIENDLSVMKGGQVYGVRIVIRSMLLVLMISCHPPFGHPHAHHHCYMYLNVLLKIPL